MVGVVCSLYEALINLGMWVVVDITYTITFIVLFFNITYVCHTAANEARFFRNFSAEVAFRRKLQE
jgi:hypothetical protein